MSEVPNEAALKEAHEAALSQADAVRSLKASLKEGSAQKVRRTAFDCGYPCALFVMRSMRRSSISTLV